MNKRFKIKSCNRDIFFKTVLRTPYPVPPRHDLGVDDGGEALPDRVQEVVELRGQRAQGLVDQETEVEPDVVADDGDARVDDGTHDVGETRLLLEPLLLHLPVGGSGGVCADEAEVPVAARVRREGGAVGDAALANHAAEASVDLWEEYQ